MKILKKAKILIAIIAAVAVLTPLATMALTLPPPMFEGEDPLFTRFEGRVTRVDDYHPLAKRILVEGAEEHNLINFIVSENTLFMTVDGPKPIEEINVGDELVVYFVMPLIEPSIFPPQREASVFVRLPEEGSPQSIFVGRFDGSLISDNNFLQINFSEDIVRLRQNGEDGSDIRLAGRALAVVYTKATRSIPAQTTPELIVVLNATPEMSYDLIPGSGYQDITRGPALLSPEEIARLSEQLAESLRGAITVVNDVEIEAPEPIVRNNLIYLPLRAIAEALGYDVHWEAETASIAIGVGIRLQIGSNEYTIGRMAPIILSNAPFIADGMTFVPMEFFSEVMGYNVGTVGAKVIVSNMSD